MPSCDVSGGESKVLCYKLQYCIGTWNVRSMNQCKLEVFKQALARVNIDLSGISELKGTRMGEFNSDDHLLLWAWIPQKKWVALIVNKRVWNAVLRCHLKNDRMISDQTVYFENIVFVVLLLSCLQLSATPWTCSLPGLPVPHYLPVISQVHIHWISDAIQPSHLLCHPLLLLPSIFTSISLFVCFFNSNSFEKTLMLGNIEGGRRRGRQRWDVCMASPAQWTWVWVSSGSWWWTGKPGMLQSKGSQRVGQDWTSELNWKHNLFDH